MEFIKSEVQDALKEAVTEVLEGTAFAEMESIMMLEALPAMRPDDYFASLKVKTPFRATLALIVNQEMLGEILSFTMDEDPNRDSEKYQRDLISELINTIAGSFLTKLLPQTVEFKIGLPLNKIGEGAEEFFELRPADFALCFTTELQKIYCAIKMD